MSNPIVGSQLDPHIGDGRSAHGGGHLSRLIAQSAITLAYCAPLYEQGGGQPARPSQASVGVRDQRFGDARVAESRRITEAREHRLEGSPPWRVRRGELQVVCSRWRLRQLVAAVFGSALLPCCDGSSGPSGAELTEPRHRILQRPRLVVAGAGRAGFSAAELSRGQY